jgi:formate/nitrite transporter FocA (FNT family)
MARALVILLRAALFAGVFIGLGTCFYASVHGDWKVAMISGAVYAFSLVMLS